MENIDNIFTLVVWSAIVTVNFLHFIYTFVYTVIFGILWAKFLRLKKEDEYEVVHTDNSLKEDQLEEIPEKNEEEHQEKNTPINNEDMHLEEDLPHVQKDDLWLSLLKWLFKK